MASREQEWEELYDQLRDALAEFGTNDAFGTGNIGSLMMIMAGIIRRYVSVT
jgi:hypothetical protein